MFQRYLPIISSKPVEGDVQLDDVAGEEDVVTDGESFFCVDHVDAEQGTRQQAPADYYVL